MIVADLSNNNHEPNWARLKRSGVAGVWLKASEGRTFVDKTFALRASRARNAGLRVGAYHFARPDANPGRDGAIFEAMHFASIVRAIGRRDLRPVLDLEHGAADPDYVRWARDWNQLTRCLLGVLPLFYSYSHYIAGLRIGSPIGSGLWLASYGPNDGARHPFQIPKPWKQIAAHQYTSNGRIEGAAGRIDLSHVRFRARVLAHPYKGRV